MDPISFPKGRDCQRRRLRRKVGTGRGKAVSLSRPDRDLGIESRAPILGTLWSWLTLSFQNSDGSNCRGLIHSVPRSSCLNCGSPPMQSFEFYSLLISKFPSARPVSGCASGG